MKLHFNLILFFCLAFAVNSHAQSGTAADSSAADINGFKQRLALLEQQRIADSVKKDNLEKQLLSLKTTDNLKKEQLQEQLEQLNTREAQRLADKRARIDSLRATSKAYPVTGFFKDTLFLVYSKLGSFSARDRAAAISNRIEALGDMYSFSSDSLVIEEVESTLDILAGETVITSISENDALWNNTTKQQLAERYKAIIGDAVAHYKAETSVATLAKEIALAALVLLVLSVIIYLSGKLFRWTALKIKEQEGKRIKGINIKNYNLFDSGRQINVLLTINTLVK